MLIDTYRVKPAFAHVLTDFFLCVSTFLKKSKKGRAIYNWRNMLFINRKSLRGVKQKRKGTATVELAVCLPLIVIITFGSIETTNMIFLEQRLTAAAYEGARKATIPGKTSADATTAVNNVLSQFSITGSSVTITPTVTATTPVGTQIKVSVTAPISSNMGGITPFFTTMINLSASTTMIHQ
jgi:Flp pilus assembly protein TadG